MMLPNYPGSIIFNNSTVNLLVAVSYRGPTHPLTVLQLEEICEIVHVVKHIVSLAAALRTSPHAVRQQNIFLHFFHDFLKKCQ